MLLLPFQENTLLGLKLLSGMETDSKANLSPQILSYRFP
jgi:hypothetical protein